MEITFNCRLAAALAARVRDARDELTRRWLDRIAARVAIDRNRIFPSRSLLDHIPLLIDGIADYLEDPSQEISADVPVTAKAIELGEMRFSQGFSAHQILKEYEILGGILFAFVARIADEIDEPCTHGELFACGHRLFRAVAAIQQVTTMHFLRAFEERVNEREERLRSFNRMVSHELKTRLGAVLGAGALLQEDLVLSEGESRARFTRMVVENARGMEALLEDLIALSRTSGEVRQQRHVLLPEAVAEVFRQLREMARARGVELRADPGLPRVEINAAVVELCLTNYVSNAIKYSDPTKAERLVEVRGKVEADLSGRRELVVGVHDNGLGVPEAARERLFQRFFRAHDSAVTGVDGTGLGLSIVRETIETIGGRAWAEFPAIGSSFFLALRCRRGAARAAGP